MGSTVTLIQTALALRNLLDRRHDDLVRSKAGRYYEARLVELRTGIDDLPPALTGGAALADVLAATDLEHDGHGSVLWFVTEAVLRDPRSTAEDRAAAERIRQGFIPALGELQDTYVLEAHRAAERRPLLGSMKADLERFKAPGGDTLLAVATRFLDAGERLNALLDERGSVPETDRSRATVLRSKAVGVLGRLRADLTEEVASDPTLPRDLVHRVFGHLDALVAMAKPGAAKEPAPVDPAKPA
jgi:hypothetical protein